MNGAATISVPSAPTTRFFEFLRQELKPTPTRWRATLRITLACVAASWPVMAFHLHLALIVMILMFLLTKDDTTTTLLGTILGVLGITIGSGLLLLTYILFADLTWMRVLLVPVFITLGLFLNRIITLGPLGSAIGIPLALGMVVPDIIPSAEFLTRFPFYLWWAAILGLCTNLAVQYAFNPVRAQTALARGLTSRLDAVEAALLRLAGDDVKGHPSGSLVSLSLSAADQLHLLKMASAAEPFLKRRYERVAAQIILIDRLVTSAAVLEEQGVQLPNEAIAARLRRIAAALPIWRQAILERRWPKLQEPPAILPLPLGGGEGRGEGAGEPHVAAAPPMLLELERVLHIVSKTSATEGLPDELKAFPLALKGGALVPDAFKNPVYLQSAVKGGLAGFICYLIFTLCAYQGIYTSVVTVIVCSLSSIGASVQKGILRLGGSTLGGLLGVLALTCIFPYVDSIGGFWFPFGAVTALAAYVATGSPALSYGGYQIGLAFYKCVLQSYGPYTELRVVRDRLIGILLGLAAFELINNLLWPMKAVDMARVKLASALQTFAKLAALPDENKDPTPRLAEAYDLRLQAFQQLHAVHDLLASAKFEPGEQVRRGLEAITSNAQRLLLFVLASIQHRADLRPEAVPEPLRLAAVRFRTALSGEFQALSAHTLGQADQPKPDLQAPLSELETSVASQINAVTDPDLAAQIRGRLALYQQIVAIVPKLR